MISVPFWTIAVLILASIVFAVLAEVKRREAARLARQLAIAVEQARKESWADGHTTGYKRGWGESYAAALKAQRQGRDPVTAIVRTGRMNAPALLELNEVLECA